MVDARKAAGMAAATNPGIIGIAAGVIAGSLGVWWLLRKKVFDFDQQDDTWQKLDRIQIQVETGFAWQKLDSISVPVMSAASSWQRLDVIGLAIGTIDYGVTLSKGTVYHSQVEIYWQGYDPPGESWWRIERATNPSFSGAVQYTSSGNTYFDNNVDPQTTYYYRVQAYTLSKTYPWSNTITVTTPAEPGSAPAAPSNLNAVATSPYAVSLSWRDNSGDETGFTIRRTKTDVYPWTQVSWNISANLTSYSDSAGVNKPQPGKTYHYQIRAYNQYGASAWSNEVVVTTPPESVGQGIHIEPAFGWYPQAALWFCSLSNPNKADKTLYFQPVTTPWEIPDLDTSVDWDVEVVLYDGIGPLPGSPVGGNGWKINSVSFDAGHLYEFAVIGGVLYITDLGVF